MGVAPLWGERGVGHRPKRYWAKITAKFTALNRASHFMFNSLLKAIVSFTDNIVSHKERDDKGFLKNILFIFLLGFSDLADVRVPDGPE